MRAESPEPFDARAYVDTGPVQERVYAQYAGLGWIGKNTCLINPELGSWLFLGGNHLHAAARARRAGARAVRRCTRCLEACPTGALVEPGVLDATRCLSYLTIELRGDIPDGASRRRSATHVYGCDICQEVCPYNQAAPRSDDAGVAAAAGARPAALVDLWRRPDAELRALIKGSAMTRAKLTGLRRNVAVAIGNSGDADASAALDEREPRSAVRRRADRAAARRVGKVRCVTGAQR